MAFHSQEPTAVGTVARPCAPTNGIRKASIPVIPTEVPPTRNLGLGSWCLSRGDRPTQATAPGPSGGPRDDTDRCRLTGRLGGIIIRGQPNRDVGAWKGLKEEAGQSPALSRSGRSRSNRDESDRLPPSMSSGLRGKGTGMNENSTLFPYLKQGFFRPCCREAFRSHLTRQAERGARV